MIVFLPMMVFSLMILYIGHLRFKAIEVSYSITETNYNRLKETNGSFQVRYKDIETRIDVESKRLNCPKTYFLEIRKILFLISDEIEKDASLSASVRMKIISDIQQEIDENSNNDNDIGFFQKMKGWIIKLTLVLGLLLLPMLAIYLTNKQMIFATHIVSVVISFVLLRVVMVRYAYLLHSTRIAYPFLKGRFREYMFTKSVLNEIRYAAYFNRVKSNTSDVVDIITRGGAYDKPSRIVILKRFYFFDAFITIIVNYRLFRDLSSNDAVYTRNTKVKALLKYLNPDVSVVIKP